MTDVTPEQIASSIAQHVMDDPEIQQYCDQIARMPVPSRATNSELYWATYSNVMVKCVLRAAQKLSLKEG